MKLGGTNCLWPSRQRRGTEVHTVLLPFPWSCLSDLFPEFTPSSLTAPLLRTCSLRAAMKFVLDRIFCLEIRSPWYKSLILQAELIARTVGKSLHLLGSPSRTPVLNKAASDNGRWPQTKLPQQRTAEEEELKVGWGKEAEKGTFVLLISLPTRSL